MDSAVLSNKGAYTTFTFHDQTITFLSSKDLSRYLEVKEWDAGYMVVLARYHSRPDEEEYIDLEPILRNLYMDPTAFLTPIKEVIIQNE